MNLDCFDFILGKITSINNISRMLSCLLKQINQSFILLLLISCAISFPL